MKKALFFIVLLCVFSSARAEQLYNCYSVGETRLDRYIDKPVGHPIYMTILIVEKVDRQEAEKKMENEIKLSDNYDNDLLSGYFCFPVEKDGGADSPAGQFINNLHNTDQEQKNNLFPLG